jgi:hypothetical protein
MQNLNSEGLSKELRTFNKPKRNKLSIDDKIAVEMRTVIDRATNLVDLFLVPGSNNFKTEDLIEIHFWLDNFVKMTYPLGQVIGYGAEIEDQLRNVHVAFTHQGRKLDMFFTEEQITKFYPCVD